MNLENVIMERTQISISWLRNLRTEHQLNFYRKAAEVRITNNSLVV